MCLTVKGGNFTLGAAVTVEECGAGISQNWRYDGQLIAPAQTAVRQSKSWWGESGSRSSERRRELICEGGESGMPA
jgi:hypothetical protein